MVKFSEGAAKFLEYLEVVKNASKHTLRNYGLDLKAFVNFSGDKSLNQIDKKTIRSFLAHLSEGGAAKKSLARRFSSLRSCFSYLVKQKLVSHNPLDELESPKLDRTIPQVLTYQEIEHFLSLPDTESHLGLRDRALMELFYSSGLRLSELVNLSRSDIQGNVVRVMGKGRKERLVPVTDSSLKWLKKYLAHPERHLGGKGRKAQADPDALFLNRFGKRITVRSIDRLFRSYLLKSGLSARITPHTIRHTIATHWLEKGMDLKTIQTLLGHSSLGATTIYTQVSSRLKKDVYDRAHPLSIDESGEGR